MRPTPEPLVQPFNLALPQSRLEGCFSHNGDLVIAGRFNGSMHVTGDVLLSASACYTGELYATNVRLRGRFEGRLVAAGGVMLQGEARCCGEVDAAWLCAGDQTVIEADLRLGLQAEAA